MVRPRWHDALLISAIAGLLVIGIWSLWWDDVRAALQLGPGSADAPGELAAPIARGQT
jgi:hypothetical protein